MAIETRSPMTGEVLATFEALEPAQVEARLALAAAAFRAWKTTTFDERAALMTAVADRLEQNADAFARLMTLEMGKPVRRRVDEALKCARGLPLLRRARRAASRRRNTWRPTRSAAYVRYEPIGAVLAVMPWNFPFWQVFRFAAPALMAGNVGAAQARVERAAVRAGDRGHLSRRGLPGRRVSDAAHRHRTQVARVLDDARVAAVTLTGSEPPGASVAASAGRADQEERAGARRQRSLHRHAERRPRRAVRTARQGAHRSTTGSRASRPSASSSPRRSPTSSSARFVAAMEALRVGDPMDERTDIGPLATRRSSRRTSTTQVERLGRRRRARADRRQASRRAGLLLSADGARRHSDATRPPIATRCSDRSRRVFRVRGRGRRDRASRTTRASASAPASGRRDAAESERFVDALEAGQVFVNAMVASDPRLPFGGVKNSGYGRELSLHGSVVIRQRQRPSGSNPNVSFLSEFTPNQVRGFFASWAGVVLDGVDSFIYALVLVPAMRDLLPHPGSSQPPATWASTAASCFPCS